MKARAGPYGSYDKKCLLTELGRAGRENIWPSVIAHGPRCARSVRHDLGPNIFPSGPPTQSISTYYAPIKSKLQLPPAPRANLGHLTTSCAWVVGNLTFTWVGWGKLNNKCEASSDFLFRAPKSLIAINTCLDEMEEFKGRDRTFVSDWLTKKDLQKL